MKLHANYIDGISSIISKVIDEQVSADYAVKLVLKSNPKWGGRDRRGIAKAAYDIIRNLRHYSSNAKSENLKEIIEYYWEHQEVVLRSDEPFEEAYSIPDDFLKILNGELDLDIWQKEMVACHGEAPIYIRVNTEKTNLAKLSSQLKKLEIEHRVAADALILEKRIQAKDNPLYVQGLFEFQDLGSQMIGSFLNPSPNSLVIDACAGAGGKSLHLSNIMKNTGNIIALDVEEAKLNNIKLRAKRNGATNIIVKTIKGGLIKDMEEMADYLLLDVPCTGSGTIRRQPEIKYRMTKAYLADKTKTQREILDRYSMMLKPGGTMVYSTCSILPSENRGQVDYFLANHADFELIEDRQLYAHIDNTDGFYMAKLKRK
ncbi:MAG: RsmB/NOP family class I SAM-dependent RNA methyltransferase [Chitinophagales bacterium]|nr:RsmB/NOP family class I SAM-dependent RNA methyltransferase [Chitinophagales bacterium]